MYSVSLSALPKGWFPANALTLSSPFLTKLHETQRVTGSWTLWRKRKHQEDDAWVQGLDIFKEWFFSRAFNTEVNPWDCEGGPSNETGSHVSLVRAGRIWPPPQVPGHDLPTDPRGHPGPSGLQAAPRGSGHPPGDVMLLCENSGHSKTLSQWVGRDSRVMAGFMGHPSFQTKIPDLGSGVRPALCPVLSLTRQSIAASQAISGQSHTSAEATQGRCKSWHVCQSLVIGAICPAAKDVGKSNRENIQPLQVSKAISRKADRAVTRDNVLSGEY